MNASRSGEPVRIGGMREVADRFDLFLIDQWGTIHDGYRPLAGAIPCLTRLTMLAKRIALLSNSSQRAFANRDRMREIGIDETLYSCVITSGELIWRALKTRDEPEFAALGEKCFLLSRDGTSPLLDGLDLEIVAQPEQASFVLISGVTPGKRMADYRPLLETCVSHGLPAVCANPDRIGVDGEDRPAAPGALAYLYETIGGTVLYRGKPDSTIYAAAIEETGYGDRSRIVSIGDSLEHDIAGGVRHGFASVLVTSGLHAPELAGDEAAFDARLAAAVAHHGGEMPSHLIENFVW